MDNINHPTHYNQGKIEVIEAIEDWKLPFHRANAVKYIARAGRKPGTNEMEDLQKAVWYLRREIELLEASKTNREARRPNEMPNDSPEKTFFPMLEYFPADFENILLNVFAFDPPTINQKFTTGASYIANERFQQWYKTWFNGMIKGNFIVNDGRKRFVPDG